MWNQKTSFLRSIFKLAFNRFTLRERHLIYDQTTLAALSLNLPSELIRALPANRNAQSLLSQLSAVCPFIDYATALLEALNLANTPCAQWLFIVLVEGHTSKTSVHMASLLSLNHLEIQASTKDLNKDLASLVSRIAKGEITISQIQQLESKPKPGNTVESLVGKTVAALHRVHEAYAFHWILQNGLVKPAVRYEAVRAKVAQFVACHSLVFMPSLRPEVKKAPVDDEMIQERAKNSLFKPPQGVSGEVRKAWMDVVSSDGWREGKLRD